ncbi:hypothetical protein EK904_007494 [Melospiza melodia maxima]|nr:hypothetical protein EK904_007494 [Melospiza melodia maxima]
MMLQAVPNPFHTKDPTAGFIAAIATHHMMRCIRLLCAEHEGEKEHSSLLKKLEEQCYVCLVPGVDAEGDYLGGMQGVERVLLHFAVDIFKEETGVVPGCCIFKVKFTVFVPDKRNPPQYFAPGLSTTNIIKVFSLKQKLNTAFGREGREGKQMLESRVQRMEGSLGTRFSTQHATERPAKGTGYTWSTSQPPRMIEDCGKRGNTMAERRQLFAEMRAQDLDRIRLSTYRTACKLRFVQKKCNCKYASTSLTYAETAVNMRLGITPCIHKLLHS